MSSKALSVDMAPHLVPDDRTIEMLEACARQLAEVATIPEVSRIITRTEAISAVLRKVKASDQSQKAALMLRVEAEVQLGRLTKQIPKGLRGGAAVKNPGLPTKRKVLAEHGIHNFRASVAERLADTPREALVAAVQSAPANTLYAVGAQLGYRKPWRDYQIPEVTARNLGFLAIEAVELLERCAKDQTAPHRGTVAEMRTRLDRLRTREGES